MSRTYHLEVASEYAIPADVLVEHVAVALRDFKYAGKTSVALRGQAKRETGMARQHPFEGPEMFDDYKPGTSREGGFLPPDPYPLTTRVIDAIKETRRHGND